MLENIKKYNYWENEKPVIGYERTTYLNRIKKYIGNNLVKVIVGQRRVGKSYLMRQVIHLLLKQQVNPRNIFYFNKEYLAFDEISGYNDLNNLIEEYFKEIKPNGKIYLFFDEIQQIHEWEKLVNSYSQDYTGSYEIFISGSNSKILSGELATYLSGRYIQFEVLSFSFNEYCGYYNLPSNRDSYVKYLQEGGMPELFNLPDEESKMHYISSLRDTIILRDIVDRYKIKDSVLLEDLFKFITNNTASLFSINNIVNYLSSSKRKTNYETISNYLEFLKNAFLVYECERFDIRCKSLLTGERKYYLNDLSFYNYLYPGFRHGAGYMLENIIYLHYRRFGYKIYTGIIKGREVDFVLQKGEEMNYVQVCYLLKDASTIEREFNSLKSIMDNHKKIVVSMDDIALKNNEGIKHQLAWNL